MERISDVETYLMTRAIIMNETANYAYLLEGLSVDDKQKNMVDPLSEYNVAILKNKTAKEGFESVFNTKYEGSNLEILSKDNDVVNLNFVGVEIKALHSAYNLVFKNDLDIEVRVYDDSSKITIPVKSLEAVAGVGAKISSSSSDLLEDMFKYHK
ncbi:MAG: hypothetical protein ACLFN8_01265 [Candidatus Woesearchaeota archaeon]